MPRPTLPKLTIYELARAHATAQRARLSPITDAKEREEYWTPIIKELDKRIHLCKVANARREKQP